MDRLQNQGQTTFSSDDKRGLSLIFEQQKRACMAAPEVPWVQREDRLKRLARIVETNAAKIAEAISSDFGHRSAHETDLLEVFPSLSGIAHCLSHGEKWMRGERRATGKWFLPGSSRVTPQPLGVAGIIVPWNYPLYLAVGPLAAALTAGNRAMLKLSEITPAFGALFEELCGKAFPVEEIAVVNGDASVGVEFSKLPFDHLLFTGSTSVGKHVMRAAADNLTPVTLELGGKSPAIVAPGYSIKRKMYPDILRTPDYSSIVSERHYQRITGYLENATAQGAVAQSLAANGELPNAASRRIPPIALTRVKDSMRLMQDEIFGPLLPIVGYETIDDAIAYVNARPRPLALYLFDDDNARIDSVLARTTAGGVTINDTLLHIAQESLPFGGVGPSGMGAYHGYEGFLAFSKMKPVFRQSRFNGVALFNPPYGTRTAKMIAMLKRWA